MGLRSHADILAYCGMTQHGSLFACLIHPWVVGLSCCYRSHTITQLHLRPPNGAVLKMAPSLCGFEGRPHNLQPGSEVPTGRYKLAWLGSCWFPFMWLNNQLGKELGPTITARIFKPRRLRGSCPKDKFGFHLCLRCALSSPPL